VGGLEPIDRGHDGLGIWNRTDRHISNTGGAPSVFMGAFVLFSVVFWCCGEGFGVSALR